MIKLIAIDNKPTRKYICDSCEQQWSFSDEPVEDALRSLSKKGWVIFHDGRILCEECYSKLLRCFSEEE